MDSAERPFLITKTLSQNVCSLFPLIYHGLIIELGLPPHQYTLGQLLALVITPASEQDRTQVKALAQHVQQVTGDSVQFAFVDHSLYG